MSEPKSAEARTRDGEGLTRYRVRTEIAKHDAGWYVEVLFWWNERAVNDDEPPRPEDDGLLIGPWPSRQVARRELRGDVRRLVVDALQDFARTNGAKFERFEVGTTTSGGEHDGH